VNKECWNGLMTMYDRDLMRDFIIAERLGIDIKTSKIEIQNIVASIKLDTRLDIDKMAFELENSEYEPETFPGLVYKMKGNVTFLVFGTGKIARRFEDIMPEGCRMWGVVRQQLLVDERIPYTSHNSSACVVVDISDHSKGPSGEQPLPTQSSA
jgi:hypothetical protein